MGDMPLAWALNPNVLETFTMMQRFPVRKVQVWLLCLSSCAIDLPDAEACPHGGVDLDDVRAVLCFRAMLRLLW